MKSALVTGATAGIGYETARQLLAQGLQVLIHGRRAVSAQAAVKSLMAEAPHGMAIPVWADLASMSEVAGLAAQVLKQTSVLDVLINNAGVYATRRELSVDGFELTMAVNHFAPYLLTRLLLPAVHVAPAGRIVTVSSMTHQSGKLDIQDLTFGRGWDAYGAYSNSKLANILFTRALAERLNGGRVTANALHPGVIDTKLLRAAFQMKGAPVAQGARTSVYLATSPEVAGVSGEYHVDCRVAKPAASARDVRLATALWSASERLLLSYL